MSLNSAQLELLRQQFGGSEPTGEWVDGKGFVPNEPEPEKPLNQSKEESLRQWERGALIHLGYPPEMADQLAGTGYADKIIEGGKRYGSTKLGPDTVGDNALGGLGKKAKADARAAVTETQDKLYEASQPETDFLQDLLDEYKEKLGGDYDALSAGMHGVADEYESAGKDYVDSLRGSEGYSQAGREMEELMGIYNAGGLTDVTKANLEKARRDEDQWIRAQRGAQLQDLAERGMAGGGAELLGGIGDRAAAADRMSARDLETNAFAQEQALDALYGAGKAGDRRYGYDREMADATAQTRALVADKRFDANTLMNTDIINFFKNHAFPMWEQIFENADALRKGLTQPAAEITLEEMGGVDEGNRDKGATVTGITHDDPGPQVAPLPGALPAPDKPVDLPSAPPPTGSTIEAGGAGLGGFAPPTVVEEEDT